MLESEEGPYRPISDCQDFSHDKPLLAPSPRVLAYLARRAAQRSPTMSLVAIPESPKGKPEVFEPPPPVVTTPCDPWPRPYLLEDGLRKVAPYHYTYNTYCKERWRGKELLEIFATEFRDRPQEYYVGPWCRHEASDRLTCSRKMP